ncbi:MAG: hypothetical protein AAFY76_02090 [Cyanobacteria bacterium J06649_11]
MTNEEEIIEHLITMCDDCGFCHFDAVKVSDNKNYKVSASYCDDGTGYISVNLLDENGDYLDSSRMKKSTDSCFPFPGLKMTNEPDCGCGA